MAQKTFGTLFKEARHKAGISQLAISKRLGFSSAQFISNWERDLSYPPLTHIKKIADILHADARALANSIVEYQVEQYRLDLETKVKDFFKNGH